MQHLTCAKCGLNLWWCGCSATAPHLTRELWDEIMLTQELGSMIAAKQLIEIRNLPETKEATNGKSRPTSS